MQCKREREVENIGIVSLPIAHSLMLPSLISRVVGFQTHCFENWWPTLIVTAERTAAPDGQGQDSPLVVAQVELEPTPQACSVS